MAQRFRAVNDRAGSRIVDEEESQARLVPRNLDRPWSLSGPVQSSNYITTTNSKKTKSLVHKIQEKIIKGSAATTGEPSQLASSRASLNSTGHQTPSSANSNSLFRMLGRDAMLRQPHHGKPQRRNEQQEPQDSKLTFLSFQSALFQARKRREGGPVDVKAIASSASQDVESWPNNIVREEDEKEQAWHGSEELQCSSESDWFASGFVVSKKSFGSSSRETTTTTVPCSSVNSRGGGDMRSECSDITGPDRVVTNTALLLDSSRMEQVKIIPRFPQNEPRVDRVRPPRPSSSRVQRRRSSASASTTVHRSRRRSASRDRPRPPKHPERAVPRSSSCSSRTRPRQRRSSVSTRSTRTSTSSQEVDQVSTTTSRHQRDRRASLRSMGSSAKSMSSLASASSRNHSGGRRRTVGRQPSGKSSQQRLPHDPRGHGDTTATSRRRSTISSRHHHHHHHHKTSSHQEPPKFSSIDDMLLHRNHPKKSIPVNHPRHRGSSNNKKKSTTDGLHPRQIARRRSLGSRSGASRHRRRSEQQDSCAKTETPRSRRSIPGDGSDVPQALLQQEGDGDDSLPPLIPASLSSPCKSSDVCEEKPLEEETTPASTRADRPNVSWADALEWWQRELARHGSAADPSTKPDRWASDV